MNSVMTRIRQTDTITYNRRVPATANGGAVALSYSCGLWENPAADATGRVVSEADTNTQESVAYSYAPVADGDAALFNDSRPRRVVSNLWGRAVSVTGTAVTPEFYTYGVTADGLRWTRAVTGETPDSPRFRTVYRDMLGRTVREESPAFGGGTVVISRSHDSLGRVLSATKSFTMNGVTEVAGDFDADGVYLYRLIHPDSTSAEACHTVTARQEGEAVGKAWYNGEEAAGGTER